MAPERQKAKGTSRMRSKTKDRQGRGISSSRLSASGVRATRPQNTILQYLQSSSFLPATSERRTPPRAASSGTLRSDFSSATSKSTFAGRLNNGSSTGPVAISTAFPEPSSSSSSLSSNIPPSVNESLGNVRSRRVRDWDEPPSSRSLVRQHYGGKECIPGAL
ncbi:hypothetical protein DER45DRAFT_463033, partial [Fusarium avenaceum]